tara:strand:- start:155 stop:364 length:210 start_codon:yes stop_codon:yes gene_type:complete
MPRRNRSQKLIILDLLRDGIPVTPMMALNRCGCFRLAAVVHQLRREGHKIKTQQVKSHTGNNYAEYTYA